MLGQPEKIYCRPLPGGVGQAHDLASDGCGAHFYIYWDGTIYQRCSLDAVPWAVGTAGYYTQKHPEARNSNTISIEMCCKCDGNAASAEDKRWYFTKETQEACAWLVAKLRHELGGVSTKSQQAGYVKYTQLAASAKKKCRRLSGNKAKLKKGGVVEIKKAVTAWDGSIWVQIKSGWLPAVVKGKYRVKAVL